MGIEVTEQQILQVLRDSVVHGLEGGVKGNRFPTLHQYLDMDGDDVDNATVKRLREDFVKIQEYIGRLEIGLYQDGTFVQVTAVNGTGHISDPDAPIVLRTMALPRQYSPIEKLVEALDEALGQCDEAIRRGCGFGRYTTD